MRIKGILGKTDYEQIKATIELSAEELAKQLNYNDLIEMIRIKSGLPIFDLPAGRDT
jgi:hypothetical protein